MNCEQIRCVVNIPTNTTINMDQDENKSETFTSLCHNTYSTLQVYQDTDRKVKLNIGRCMAVELDHFITTDPGESKVTIWLLATITDPCFNMQMFLFSQCGRNLCWTRQQLQVQEINFL